MQPIRETGKVQTHERPPVFAGRTPNRWGQQSRSQRRDKQPARGPYAEGRCIMFSIPPKAAPMQARLPLKKRWLITLYGFIIAQSLPVNMPLGRRKHSMQRR